MNRALPVVVLKMPLARRVRQVEAAGLAHPLVVLRRSRARRARLRRGCGRSRRQALPVDGRATARASRARAARRSRGSLRRSADAGSSTPRDTCTTPIEFSVVTNCCSPALHVALGAAEAGQDQRLLAGDRWARFSFVETCTVSRQRRSAARRVVRVRRRREEVAAERDEDLHPPVVHRLDRARRCPGRACRGGAKSNSCAERLEECRASAAPRCRRSGRPARCCGRARDRAPRPAARSAAEQREVHDLLDVGDAVLCCVSPIAQQRSSRSDSATISAASSDLARAARRSPSTISSHALRVERPRRTRRSLRCAAR